MAEGQTNENWWSDPDLWDSIIGLGGDLIANDQAKGKWVGVKQDPAVSALFGKAAGFLDKPSDVRGGMIGMTADKLDQSAMNSPFKGMSLLDVPGGEAMSQGPQPSFFSEEGWGGSVDPEWTDMMRKFARGESTPTGGAPSFGSGNPDNGASGFGKGGWNPAMGQLSGSGIPYNKEYGPANGTGFGGGRAQATDVDAAFGPGGQSTYVPTPDGGLSKRPTDAHQGGWEGATFGDLANSLFGPSNQAGAAAMETVLGMDPGQLEGIVKTDPGVRGMGIQMLQWAKANPEQAARLGFTAAAVAGMSVNPIVGALVIIGTKIYKSRQG